MSNSTGGLTVYTSLSSLSIWVQDVLNVYLFPSISFVGSILNIICIGVLWNKDLKGKLFQFLLLIITSDFLKLITSIFLVVFRCGTLCSSGYNYYWKLYEQYVFLYFDNVCTVFGSLINLAAAFDRCFSFYPKLARNFDKYATLKLKCIVLLSFSVVINLPEYVITRSTVQIGWLLISNGTNSTDSTSDYMPLYSVVSNSLSKIVQVKVALFVIAIIRKLLLLVMLLVVNTFVSYKFRQHIKKKQQLTHHEPSKTDDHASKKDNHEETAIKKSTSPKSSSSGAVVSNNSVTKMIMVMSLSCFMCNIQDAFTPILFVVINTATYNIYILSSNFTLLTVRACNIFLLYAYCQPFRRAFSKLFCRFRRPTEISLRGEVPTRTTV